MGLRLFKYLSPFLLYYGAFTSFASTGLMVWVPLIYSWIIIPLLELCLRGDASNLTEAEEELAKRNKWYDYLLYLIVPCQYLAMAFFIYSVTYQQQGWIDVAGKTCVMGLLCGVMGINVGHELGHRNRPLEKYLAKALLLSSLYMHFYVEHNRGHHKRVATPQDPSSARYGEMLYFFLLRSMVMSYVSAWKISNREVLKKGYQVLSTHNEMIGYQLIQCIWIVAIIVLFGWVTAGLFLLAALQGILLLETVNYIEHYGLQRRQTINGSYERALPQHSWNSNHVIGRVMLFELSRHSDHHFLASRKYQLLRHHDHSPQMPTGYPGMMILAIFPPAWFYVMNKRVNQVQDDSRIRLCKKL